MARTPGAEGPVFSTPEIELRITSYQRKCYRDIMIRTQIQLTESQYNALKERAKALNTSMAEMIRDSVQLYLSKAEVRSAEERRRSALSIAGRFDSGLANLAEEHDRYSDEAFSE